MGFAGQYLVAFPGWVHASEYMKFYQLSIKVWF